jgi:hypothetical protein
MDCYDVDTRRLLYAERIEQLTRDAGPTGERMRRHRFRLPTLHGLLRRGAYRRRPQPTAITTNVR